MYGLLNPKRKARQIVEVEKEKRYKQNGADPLLQSGVLLYLKRYRVSPAFEQVG